MHTLSWNFKILFGIATFGLVPAIFPGYVHWSDPPISESMRRSRQRRWRPEGYPWKSDRLPAEQKQRLRELFSWKERWRLFWTTPIVIFYLDKIMYMAFTLMFSIWFVAHRQAVDSGKYKIIIMHFEVSSNLDEESLQSVEIALCIYFGSSFLRELTEVLCELGTAATVSKKVDVLVHYFSSLWNVLDVGEIIAFCVGIGYRVSIAARLSALAGKIPFDEFVSALPTSSSSTNPPPTSSTTPDGLGSGEGSGYQGEKWTNWSMAYGICLSIAWFRVLRSGDALL
jgi:hypothetical protein